MPLVCHATIVPVTPDIDAWDAGIGVMVGRKLVPESPDFRQAIDAAKAAHAFSRAARSLKGIRYVRFGMFCPKTVLL